MKTAAIALLGVIACASLAAQNAVTVAQQFQNPAKAYRPMVRWWWPGGDVTDAELHREVVLLDQANFGGGEIQPFVIGLHTDMPADTRKRVDDYLTPTFYAHVSQIDRGKFRSNAAISKQKNPTLSVTFEIALFIAISLPDRKRYAFRSD